MNELPKYECHTCQVRALDRSHIQRVRAITARRITILGNYGNALRIFFYAAAIAFNYCNLALVELLPTQVFAGRTAFEHGISVSHPLQLTHQAPEVNPLEQNSRKNDGFVFPGSAVYNDDFAAVPEYSKSWFNLDTRVYREDLSIKSTRKDVLEGDPEAYFHYSLLVRDGLVPSNAGGALP
jgi:hypothetical protein